MAFTSIFIFLHFTIIQSIRLSTTITQQSQLLMLNDLSMHPWFMDSNQAFIDWQQNAVRQFVVHNTKNHRINVTILVLEQNQIIVPFIQESLKQNQPLSEQFRFTLLPNQQYIFNLEYNCTDIQNITTINLLLEEQSFKHNINERDYFRRYTFRILKQCVNQIEPIIDWYNIYMLIIVFLISIFCSLLNILLKNQKTTQPTIIEFTRNHQIVVLIIIPILSYFFIDYINGALELFQFLIALLSIWDFIIQFVKFRIQIFNTIISLLLTILILLYQIQYQQPILQFIFMILCIIQVSKRIILKTQVDLYIFLVIIWILEINWLAHLQTVDKHILNQQNENDNSLIFRTSLQLTEQTNEKWIEKQIDIQLYQIIALTLIQSFNLRNGLFNSEHIKRIFNLSLFQFLGLMWFDILYRNKLNPPFLTIVTGSMIFGISINYWIQGKGLKSPYLKFTQFSDDQIKLKVSE